MSRIDRALQKKILEALDDAYPSKTWPEFLNEMDEHTVAANLKYLEQHRLIEKAYDASLSDDFLFHDTVITAAGVDFLKNDGGLTAVLGVVTVRLEAEQFRTLIASKIQASDLPPETKKTYLDHLKDLPSEMLSEVAKRALDAGLDQVPNLRELLGTLLGS
jgi:hypothetical protein